MRARFIWGDGLLPVPVDTAVYAKQMPVQATKMVYGPSLDSWHRHALTYGFQQRLHSVLLIVSPLQIYLFLDLSALFCHTQAVEDTTKRYFTRGKCFSNQRFVCFRSFSTVNKKSTLVWCNKWPKLVSMLAFIGVIWRRMRYSMLPCNAEKSIMAIGESLFNKCDCHLVARTFPWIIAFRGINLFVRWNLDTRRRLVTLWKEGMINCAGNQ